MFLLLASFLGGLAAGCSPVPYIIGAASGSAQSGSQAPPNASPTLVLRTPGTVQRLGRATIELELADAEDDAATVAFSFSVAGSPFAPASATLGAPVATGATLAAPSGGASYAFVWDTGADGVTNSADVLVAVVAADARSGRSVRATTGRLSVVNIPLRLDTSALPTGTAGIPEIAAATAVAAGGAGSAYAFDAATLLRGGLPPYRLSIRVDPPFLGLGGATGALSGTARRSGRYVLTIAADDGTLDHVEATVALTVQSAVQVPVKAIPPAEPGIPYSWQIPVRGGTPPYAFTLASGALPGGLALDASGTVSGTPAAPAAATVTSFTVRAADARGFAIDAPLKVRVAAPRPIARARVIPRLDPNGGALGYAIADLDGDGRDDMIRVGLSFFSFSTTIDAYPGQADGTFAGPTALAALPFIFAFNSVRSGDWNGDGRADLLVNQGGSYALLTSTTTPLVYDVATPFLGADAAVGNVDGQGDAIVYTSSTSVFDEFGNFLSSTSDLYLLRQPHSPLAMPVIVASVAGPASLGVVVADLDGDGRSEIHALDQIFAYDPANMTFVARLALPGPDPFSAEAAFPVGGGAHGIARTVFDAMTSGFVLDVARFSGSFDPAAAPPVVTPLGSVPFDPALLGSPRLGAGAIGLGGAPGIAVSGSNGPTFLVTVTGNAVAPCRLDADHVAFAPYNNFGTGGFVGVARAAGAADRVIFAEPGFPDELLLALTPDADGRLDGFDARVLPFNAQGALSVALGSSPRPDLVIGTSYASLPGVSDLQSAVRSPIDAEGRLGAPQPLVVQGNGEVVIATIAVRDRAGSVRLAQLVSPFTVERFVDIYAPASGTGTDPLARALRLDVPRGDSIASADLDGDGEDEILVSWNDGLTTYIISTDGATSATISATVFSGGGNNSGSVSVRVVDLDRDGLPDLTFGTPGALLSIRQVGNLEFEPAGSVSQVSFNRFLASSLFADVDRDDTQDVVAGSFGGSMSQITVSRNRDGAILAPEEVANLPAGPVTGGSEFLFGPIDANLDGVPDFVLSGDELRITLLLGDGAGGLTPGPLADFGLVNSFPPLIADIDQDGVEDLVFFRTSPSPTAIITLFGDGRGGFRRADPAPLPPCGP